MNKRTILRSIARERMQGTPNVNRPYTTKDGVYASIFARNWRIVLGMAPKPLKKTRAASIRFAPKSPTHSAVFEPAKRSVFQKISDFLRRPATV